MNNRRVIVDFFKAFSCAYSITRNLGEALGLAEDPVLLQAVPGFGSGVAAMGDTCGAASSGCVVLGSRFADRPETVLYPLCAEFYRRLQQRRGTPDCGRLHGGRHLADNLRRAILTGKSLRCMGVLRQSAQIAGQLAAEVNAGEFPGKRDYPGMEEIIRYFSEHSFHCCHTAMMTMPDDTSQEVALLLAPSRGFCGGIGLNGTLCGAIAGGVLRLGLKEGVDLRSSGYIDGLRTVWGGLTKSGAVFQDERIFPPARLFSRCRQVYQAVEKRFGGAHCRQILGLNLNTATGVRRYITENRIDLCREVVETVATTIGDAVENGRGEKK